jgi:hypothetical protein
VSRDLENMSLTPAQLKRLLDELKQEFELKLEEQKRQHEEELKKLQVFIITTTTVMMRSMGGYRGYYGTSGAPRGTALLTCMDLMPSSPPWAPTHMIAAPWPLSLAP